MHRFSLEEILSNDPYNLLGDIKTKNPTITENDRLIESFEEINRFYEANGYEPKKSNDINERNLFARLDGIKKDLDKIKILQKYDKYGLLKSKKEKTKVLNTIDDIFEEDPLGLLDVEDDIFELQHIPKTTTMPDYVASRKVCKDFDKFEEIFKKCQIDIKNGKRKLTKFKDEQQIKKGYFFVLKGVLLYVAKVGKKFKQNNKTNARLRLIFENGTESDMLLRSLSAELYKHGKRVSEYDESKIEGLFKIAKDDIHKGYIYILKSLSLDDKIATKKDLYKIGFSAIDVYQRIKNAKNDPTYLFADVEVVEVFEIFNANPQKIERLIHRFFANCCLDIDIVDTKGNIYKPNEWFIVPIDIIEEAIKLIKNEDIINYYYDYEKESIKRFK